MDLTLIRTALAAQISAYTGLRAEGAPRDQISPPVAVVVPATQLATYGQTMDGASGLSLRVLIILTDSAPVEKTQRALDAYLGIGAGEPTSVPAAIMADPTLGGTCSWAIPESAGNYGRVEWAAQIYFGAVLNVSCGA